MSGLKNKTDYTIGEDKKMFGSIHKVSGPCIYFAYLSWVFLVVVAENMSGAKMYELVKTFYFLIYYPRLKLDIKNLWEKLLNLTTIWPVFNVMKILVYSIWLLNNKFLAGLTFKDPVMRTK